MSALHLTEENNAYILFHEKSEGIQLKQSMYSTVLLLNFHRLTIQNT